MRASIIVKYYPATNTKGARWVARSSNGAGKKVTVGYYDHSFKGGQGGAYEAAIELAKNLGCFGSWACGELDSSSYVFVWLPGNPPLTCCDFSVSELGAFTREGI